MGWHAFAEDAEIYMAWRNGGVSVDAMEFQPCVYIFANRPHHLTYIGRLHWHCHFMQKLELEPKLEYLPMARW
ncbi:hypothetical protein ACR9YC_00700 [Parasphingorhabdus sp. DH2-15]|uniref:hypothetical protein n=1 Tax=Parasphingorhabdus sp. DH2-15 TaxID=3444112 RepID=UPI003F684785